MVWGAVIAGGLSLAAGAFGASGSKKAAKKQAKLDQAEAREVMRRRKQDFNAEIGMTRTMIGASGVRNNVRGSTPQKYVDEMTKQYMEEMRWMKNWGASLYKAGNDTAKSQFNAGLLNAASNAFSAAAAWWK
jgi:hypothetical protein